MTYETKICKFRKHLNENQFIQQKQKQNFNNLDCNFSMLTHSSEFTKILNCFAENLLKPSLASGAQPPRPLR